MPTLQIQEMNDPGCAALHVQLGTIKFLRNILAQFSAGVRRRKEGREHLLG